MKILNAMDANWINTPEGQEFERDYLNPNFITPLNNLGFEIKGFQSIGNDEDYSSCHIMVFEALDSFHMDTPEWDNMVEICTQDDDDQPHGQFRFYHGTLWVFIPYCL